MANYGALEWHAWTSYTASGSSIWTWRDSPSSPGGGDPDLDSHRRGPAFDDIRDWIKQLSRAIGAAVPEVVSWEWNVRDRGCEAWLDCTQNVIKATCSGPC